MEKHYSLTETANLIRKALRGAFPDVKFSVTTKRYTGGSSISVSYNNGPRTKDVYTIAHLFEGAGFDGMTDSTYFHKPKAFQGELVTFNYGFVHVTRHLDDAALQIAAYRVHKETKLPLLTFKEGRFMDGNYQVQFSYLREQDVIAPGQSPLELYSELVYEVARNIVTPHQRGQTELPQLVDARLDELKADSSAAAN
jgi:hypothetical protein